jgi:hypothetical protein
MLAGFAALFLSWYFVVFGILEPADEVAREEEAREQLVRHPFWRVEMGAQAVNEMADTIVASVGEDVLVFISEDGELLIDRDPAHIERADGC